MSAAALRAPEARDRAEPARAITSLGDLHVRPRHGRLRAREVQQIELRQRSRGHRDQLALRGRTSRHLGAVAFHRRQIERLTETGDLVDLGKRGGEFVAVALGHAAGHDEPRAVRSEFVEGEDRVDRLLTGGVDEGAGVDHDEVRDARRRRSAPCRRRGARRSACRNRRRSSGSRASRCRTAGTRSCTLSEPVPPRADPDRRPITGRSSGTSP